MRYFRLKLVSLFARYGAVTLASAAALLGLAVMLGWHFNWPRLIQILPDSAPMQYNTALAFLCSGMGVVTVACGWRKTGVALAAIALLLGLLTLLQYLLDVNLGLDQLIVQSSLTYKTSHPGRMSPLAASCFVLSGLALGLRSLSSRNHSLLTSSGLVAVVAALAAGVLVVYSAGLVDTVLQAQYTRMAVHTAAGFLLLAAAIYALGWTEGEEDARWLRQVLVPLSFCMLPATLYLWAALKVQEQLYNQREVEALAAGLKVAVEERVKANGRGLVRLARRWEFSGGTPRPLWEYDVALWHHELEGIQALEWADRAHRVQWVIPQKGNESAQGYDLNRDERRREAIERAQASGKLVLSRPIALAQGETGLFLCTPVFRRGQFDGHLLMVYHAQAFFAPILKRFEQPGDSFAFFDGAQELFRHGAARATTDNQSQHEIELNFYDTRLRLVVQPSPARIAQTRSSLPSFLLWSGLLLSSLIVLLARQLRISKQRAKELQKMYQQLGWEVEERLQSEERLRVVVEATPNALLSVEAEGRITLANALATRLFGYTRDELLGQTIELLLPPRFHQPHAKHRAHFLRESRVAAMRGNRELFALHKDGHEFPVEISLNTLSKEDGGAVLVSINDVTERKRTEQALREAKEAAEHSTRAKSLFLANMSHEIRTPLNGVIGMTSLLQQANLPPQQVEFVETIRTSGEALLTVINDILDFSKIESGKLNLEEILFDPRACVDEVLAMLAQLAGAKGLELVCLSELPPGLVVRGDEARLRQILVNLVGNAIKFTAAGEIVLSLEQHALADNRLELRCAVRDTGIGIPPEKLPLLFESFSQVDASTSRQFGGTGLGLAISKRLVEMMGGQMGVESCAGQGSTFFFTIIVGLESATELPPEHHKLAGKTVLIAVAHHATRQALAQQVTAFGMQALSAASAQEALTLTTAQPSDITLFDAALAGPARTELLAVLRQAGRPLIVLVSSGMALNDGKDVVVGDAKLSKPVKQASLFDALLAVCDPARKTHALAAEQAGAARLATDLRILVAEDNPINQRVVLHLLKASGCRADVAGNGLEALAALERQPYDLILMDQMMPELDGLEATRRIHALYGARRPYIIALTANALKGDREVCLAAGMDDYLSKPLKLEALQAALARFTTHGLAKQPATNGVPVSNAAPPDRLDLTLLKDTFSEDENQAELMTELLELYVNNTRERFSALQQAVDAGDATAFGTEAHALKGSSLQFGAARVAALCLQLETLGKAGQTVGALELTTELAAELNTVYRLLDIERQNYVSSAHVPGALPVSAVSAS